MNNYLTIVLVISLSFVSCKDFYVGMFKKNDWLVAQDRLYKERVPYKYMYAKYGRIFKCKITYFRVADRLGYGQGPKVQIIRGGLNHNYLVLKLMSPYNKPISVNIYVGCANTFTTTTAGTSGSESNTPQNNNTLTTVANQNSDGVKTTEAECTHNCNNGVQTTAGQAAETTAGPTAAK